MSTLELPVEPIADARRATIGTTTTAVPAPDTRRPALRAALVAAGITTLVGALVLAFGPPGVDRAAHVYHTNEFAAHGWRVWNNYWYAGRYELLNYSILFYPIAAVVGLQAVVLASLAGGSAAFALLMRRVAPPAGAALPALTFAVTWPSVLLAGQYPFALGTAFAVTCVLLLVSRHYLTGLLAALAAVASNPLSFLLLTVVLAGIAVGARQRIVRSRRSKVAAIGLLILVISEAIVLRLFPIEGRFPFPLIDLGGVLLLGVVGCAVARRDAALRGVFMMYSLAAVGVYLYPGGVGGNFERLAIYWPVPLLLLAYVRQGRRLRWTAGVVLVVAACLQVLPMARTFAGGLGERANNAEFWSGAIGYLRAHQDPNYRIEVVATWGHWESYHLAREGFPLTRGWFRQDDFPINTPLYAGSLDTASYRRWLNSLAVSYVVVPRDELDYSSRREAALIPAARREGWLRFEYGDAHVDIFRVRAPTSMLTLDYATGPTTDTLYPPGVLRFAATSLSLWLPSAGVYDLRVRYTPFWVTDEPDRFCIAPGGPGLTRIVAARGGPITLDFDLTLARSTSQALGSDPAPCPVAPPTVVRGLQR